MIDNEGFRANVGIILTNTQGHVFWAKRVGQNAWQFPQGGIQPDETPEAAMYRELNEEIGLSPDAVQIVAVTPGWLRYRLPAPLIRYAVQPLCIGQKQKWFLLRLVVDDDQIQLDHSDKPEFDAWRWVHYWHPLREVVSFKRRVYRKALHYFFSRNRQFPL